MKSTKSSPSSLSRQDVEKIVEIVRKDLLMMIGVKDLLVVCDTCGPTHDPVRWWGAEALCERCFRESCHGPIDYRSKTIRETRKGILRMIEQADFGYITERLGISQDELE